MLFLTIRSDGKSDTRPLRDGQTVIGRALDCDIVLNHEGVSRRHAQIVVTGTRAVASDLNSSSGLFKNGARVKETPIEPGDVLWFGSVEATVEQEAERVAAAPPAPEPPPPIALEQTIYRRVDSLMRAPATAVDADRVIRLLGEIARTLVASLSLNETLDRVVTLLLTHVPGDRAMLSMRATGEGAFVPAVTRVKEGSQASKTFSISRTVTDLVLRERVAVLTADARRDERFESAKSLYRDDIRSLMCAPLGGNASVTPIIGLLYVDNSWNHQFSVADLELFTALADYASVAVSQARLGEELKEEARRRERLSRYHSPAVVDLVLRDDHANLSIAGESRDVTILFADIVQFTTLSEEIEAGEVVRILNAFFGAMTSIVFAHQGTVDKFIGDAILVVFGAPLHQADHAERAVNTARAMQEAVAELNRQQVAPRPLQIRIAVHSGVAIVGDVGSPERLEYTVVGDVVNTAARLQSEVATPGATVVSRATLDRIATPLAVELIGLTKVRGRAAAVEAFRLLTS